MSKTYQTVISLLLAMLITMSLTAMLTSALMHIDTRVLAAMIILIYLAAFVTCMKLFEEDHD